MSDDQDKDSKTESPTEKKLSDAVEKGNTPFSREVTMFASTIAIYIFIVFFLPQGFVAHLGTASRAGDRGMRAGVGAGEFAHGGVLGSKRSTGRRRRLHDQRRIQGPPHRAPAAGRVGLPPCPKG